MFCMDENRIFFFEFCFSFEYCLRIFWFDFQIIYFKIRMIKCKGVFTGSKANIHSWLRKIQAGPQVSGEINDFALFKIRNDNVYGYGRFRPVTVDPHVSPGCCREHNTFHKHFKRSFAIKANNELLIIFQNIATFIHRPFVHTI